MGQVSLFSLVSSISSSSSCVSGLHVRGSQNPPKFGIYNIEVIPHIDFRLDASIICNFVTLTSLLEY